MVPARRHRALALLASIGVIAASAADGVDLAALASDDECQVGELGSHCSMSALQLRSHKVGEAGNARAHLTVAEGDTEAADAGNGSSTGGDSTTTTTSPSSNTTTTTVDPCGKEYGQCGGAGYSGETCCREGLFCVAKNKYYSQCVPGDEIPFEKTAEMRATSDAPLYTFYVYRVMANLTYAPVNVNVANLPGVIWYLHNEVVITSPRKFGIMKIVRFKIQTKAPKPLFDAGMNFGARYAFDRGMCTGPWFCGEMFQKYGYFVGCNKLGDFPFPTFPVGYDGGIWYSLPGECPLKQHNYQTASCREEQPGGRCIDGPPTGNGTCTYSIEEAGEIMIDDLEGIDDYQEFVSSGNQEYDVFKDEGIGMTFWNDVNNTKACAARVKKAAELFEESYPDMPKDSDLPYPPCDFDFEKFYGHPLEE